MSSRTIFTMLEETAARYAGLPALYEPMREEKAQGYRAHTWTEYKTAVEEIAAGLRRMGIQKGDIVGLCSETRPEFYMADLGIMANGSVSAALYSGFPTEELARSLRTCEAKAVIAENPKTLRLLQEAHGPSPALQWILLHGESEAAVSLSQLREQGRRAIAEDPGLISKIAAEAGSADHAILYMTSGATGEPKMVMVTHAALLANLDMGPVILELGPQDATIAFLPSAHIAQRVVGELLPIRYGMPVWFIESLAKLPQALKSVRPTIFLAPPRFWERVYTSACIEIQKRPPYIRRLFHGALGVGLEANRIRKEGRKPPLWMRSTLKLADRLIFRKLRSRFGGRLKVPVSGAAPLGKDLALFYEVIGMPLIEGYGLTEGGIVSLNPLDRPKAGSIGKVLPGVEARLAGDGELLIRGPCLLSCYHKDPQATAEVLRDGWLHTGDIAEIDEEGYIYITGRKKEVLISSSGKNIYPARIESLFHLEPIISTVILVGDRLPYVSALFTINPSAAEGLDGMERWRGRSMAELIAAEPVLAEVRKSVVKVNRQLAPFEQIRKFGLLDRELSIAHGELTPTLKVRRSRVLEIHRHRISELYGSKEESH